MRLATGSLEDGVGHHAPIGGYLEAEELVFVLDVNSGYRPWLVERKRLFAAVNTFDGDRKRGLLLKRHARNVCSGAGVGG